MLINSIANVPINTSMNIPVPTNAPIAADAHIVAAVVNPCTSSPFLKIMPAPIKPIPDTICAITRELSALNTDGDMRQNRVEPRQINDIVLVPTDFPLFSRSIPIRYPNKRERPILYKSVISTIVLTQMFLNDLCY